MNDESSLRAAGQDVARNGLVPDGGLIFHDLILLAQNGHFTWEPFQTGVERAWIYKTGANGPAAALIRFQAGATVPLHEHTGYEHVYILSGSQEDDHGESKAGTLLINPPGRRHRIYSKSGCVVLAIYEKPVKFLEEPEEFTA